jgi:hypothetical protein
MRQVKNEEVDPKTLITLYIQHAEENFRKAHQSGDISLMWAVLKNTQDTIGFYEEAASYLHIESKSVQ